MGIGEVGFLGGLANGIKEGLITYQNQQNINQTRRMQQLMAGVQEGSGGELSYTPEKQAQMDLLKKQTEQGLLNLDPASQSSKSMYAGVKALSGVDLPPGLNVEQAQKLAPFAEAKYKTDLAYQDKRSERAQKEQEKREKPTAGQEALDKSFGKEYEDYVAGGGYAGVQKNLQSARQALDLLKSGQVETGGTSGLLPKSVRDVTDPKLSQVQEALEQSVQASLRQTLGAQFTEREGQQILQRTFNPRLPTDVNIQRAEAVIADLEKRAKTKDAAARYFDEHGTLKGFNGAKMIGGAPGGLIESQPSNDSAAKLQRLRELKAKAGM